MNKHLNIYIDLSGSVAFNPLLIERMLERADNFATEYNTSALWGFSYGGTYKPDVWPIRSDENFLFNPSGGATESAYGHAKREPGDALIITDNGNHTDLRVLPKVPEHIPCLFVKEPPSRGGKQMWLLAIPALAEDFDKAYPDRVRT